MPRQTLMARKKRPARRLSRVLSAKSLQSLINQASTASQLNAVFSLSIGAQGAMHCRVARLRAGRLVVVCDHAAWATRLRMQASQLAQQLARQIGGLKRVEVIHSKLAVNRQPKTTPCHRRPSKQAADAVLAVSKNIQDDELAQAMARLSHSLRQPY